MDFAFHSKHKGGEEKEAEGRKKRSGRPNGGRGKEGAGRTVNGLGAVMKRISACRAPTSRPPGSGRAVRPRGPRREFHC